MIENDYRGEPVYNTETKSYGFIDYLGEPVAPYAMVQPASFDMSKQRLY